MRDLVSELGQTMQDGVHAPPLMRAKGLGLTLSGKELLHDLDLTIRSGRRTFIMGANGAGKSLLLRLLHGLIQPTSGALQWQDDDFGKHAQAAQALVFQRPVLLRRSVRGNLRFPLAVRGLRGRARAQLETEALERAGLTEHANTPARLLSGGEQQRLAVARALSTAPRMLLLDEPTASLDPGATRRIETLLNEAHATGVTTVLVTHDRGQAQRMADDIIFLHKGRIAETGPASQVLSDPQSLAARAWLNGELY